MRVTALVGRNATLECPTSEGDLKGRNYYRVRIFGISSDFLFIGIFCTGGMDQAKVKNHFISPWRVSDTVAQIWDNKEGAGAL